MMARTMKPVRKAVFPVAGMGTRFLPASKAIPKEMLPVVDKPLIQYAVEEAQTAGIEQFIFVTGRGKAAIEDHFDCHQELHALLAARGEPAAAALLEGSTLAPGAASFTRQPMPMGLGHAVLCARDLVGDEPFAVLLPDELLLAEPPCLTELVDAHGRTGGSVVSLAEVPASETAGYGIVAVSAREGRTVTISDMVEKPAPADAPSRLAIAGRYILQPELFGRLEAQAPGRGAEIQLTDAMATMAREGQLFHGLLQTGRRFDCGSRIGFLQATIACAMERPELRQGLLAFLRETMPSS